MFGFAVPTQHSHASSRLLALQDIDFRRDGPKRGQNIDEQADVAPVFNDELARQAPTHSYVAIVIDDATENIPVPRAIHVCASPDKSN